MAWRGKDVIDEMLDIEEEVQNASYFSRGSLGRRIRQKRFKKSGKFMIRVIWVTVSHPFNVVRLQDDIARRMNKRFRDDANELERASRLMKLMKTMKYALILDDVCDNCTLQRVGIPEPTRENGSKIFIISKSVDVCNFLRCQIVKVLPLPKQESLNLFLDEVGRDVLQISNLDEILKLIVHKCAGLPSVIVGIASGMRGVKDFCEWRNALLELPWRWVCKEPKRAGFASGVEFASGVGFAFGAGFASGVGFAFGAGFAFGVGFASGAGFVGFASCAGFAGFAFGFAPNPACLGLVEPSTLGFGSLRTQVLGSILNPAGGGFEQLLSSCK
ncbi:hypothetical protein SLEP1_g52136 [Rubroshorea leprosula]|uniref:NB-ARC domain-containing protein n=1 Tax=Rubroshorea leprosula TaxID=152421 RepID=A0AAV5M5I2_9ROSI|nr:hypothetical protein SLEP1_g52136 [Rubroshorea leprosula]